MINTIYSYFKKRKVLLIFTLIFFLIRLPFLEQTSILHDERDIFLTGYSLAQSGRDLYGNLLPFSFGGINPHNPLIPIYYSAFWSLVLPIKSIFMARLPYIILTSAFIFLVYELIYTITKNNKLALLTSLIFSFSPWIYHISRHALEINIAMPFLLAGMLAYLKKMRALAFAFFSISFYSYQGFRPLILVLPFYLEFQFAALQHKRVALKNFLTIFIFIALLVSSTFIIDGPISKSRTNEIVFLNSEKLAKKTDNEREVSTLPLSLSKYFFNKATVAIDTMENNFLKGQDVSYLFKVGDPNVYYSTVSSGQFFAIFYLFFIAGFLFIGKNFTAPYLSILGYIPIGLIPSIIHLNTSFAIRSMLTAVAYAFIIAAGMIFVHELLKKFSWHKILIYAMIIYMGINTVAFFNYYFYSRHSLISELYFENEREISSYILNKDRDLTFYHYSPRDLYLGLVFFADKVDIAEVQKSMSQREYQWLSMKIVNCGEIRPIDESKLHNIAISERCLNEEEYKMLDSSHNSIDKVKYKDMSNKPAYFVF